MTNIERVGDIVETEIIDLAYDGKSVGSVGGKVVFLDSGLPGETVRARIIKTKRRFCVGRVVEIINKSDSRVKAPCVHYGVCGGCTWQDLDYDKQLYYKRKQVVDCLRHIGKIENVNVAKAIGSKDRFFYRNKMEFSFNALDDDKFALGLHRRGCFDEIFDVRECLLESETSNEIIHWLREFVSANDIPVYNVTDHTGFIRFAVIRQAKNTGEIMLNIVTTDGAIPDVENLVEAARDKFSQIKTIVQNINDKKSNIAKGEKENILYGSGFIEEQILGYSFRIYANSFFQTNTKQAEVLYSKAFDLLAPEKSDRLLDMYCGTGTIGMCASGYVADVMGIDSEPSAIRAAEENAEINGVENIHFLAGSAEDILNKKSEIFGGLTCAIVDPPRAGLHPKALRSLMDLDLSRIIYISCNPATFSRDAAKLIGSGYKISQVVPVDMFPHTMHIELVAGFHRQV